MKTNVEQMLKDDLQKVVKESGGLVLSIDGVQSEKGNETLYVIREVLSGTILAAKNLKRSATQMPMNVIKPIMEWGFPNQGFVSDAQQSISPRYPLYKYHKKEGDY